jgi:EAL domain-containing protein (putative c-di-GMP-specific phosphodiesterase class I)
MGLTVTAEGVENRDQMSRLSEAGCNELQGYLFTPPCPRRRCWPLSPGGRARATWRKGSLPTCPLHGAGARQHDRNNRGG